MKNGSYNFGEFTKDSQYQEQARLHHQGSLLLDIDFKISREAGLKDGMKIADIGCGTGTIAGAIAQKFSKSKVWGIDSSDRLINSARKLQQERHLNNIEFALGNAYNLHFGDGALDFARSRLLFQHLPEPAKALKEIYRVLKPGGKVCSIDIADGWFALNPEPLAFKLLRERLAIVQASQGGDSEVGYKLGSYMSEAGFINIETKLELVTSERLGGIEQFLGLLSFGAPYYSLDFELKKLALSAKEETQKLADIDYAWGAFGLFVTTGVKS